MNVPAGQWHTVKALESGLEEVLGQARDEGPRTGRMNPSARRMCWSIGNLQEVIKGLLTKDAPSGIYHMSDDEALSTKELIELIYSALGKKAHIWNIPRGLMNDFAKIGDVLYLPLNTQRMQKLTENYVVSNDGEGVENWPKLAIRKISR